MFFGIFVLNRASNSLNFNSAQLHGFEGCHGESFAVCNRASLKSLAFAASDSSKSSIKIAYPERNTVGKKLMVIV